MFTKRNWRATCQVEETKLDTSQVPTSSVVPRKTHEAANTPDVGPVKEGTKESQGR